MILKSVDPGRDEECQDGGEAAAVFFCSFIHWLTIVRRDAVDRKVDVDDKLFRLIRWASSFGSSMKPRETFIAMIESYAAANPDVAGMIGFVMTKLSP